MIEINAKSPSQLADDVDSWLRSLPTFDPGDAFDRVGSELERVGSEVADLVPGRRRSRRWTGWVLPAAAVAVIAVAIGVTFWAFFTHRSPSADRFGLEELVPDAEDFDRDAAIRAAGEGMPASARDGGPADDTALRTL